MGRSNQLEPGMTPLSVETLHQAYSFLASNFDYQNGGFGAAPKFPQPMTPEFLLRYHHHGYNPRALGMVEMTLHKMAYGGMYDQIGGGFHRYSTDAFWLVPHFEKMLYDNALLARLYLHAWQLTGNDLYQRICEETLDYVLREMTDPLGGFYSAQDADSEGEEGKFFIWSPEEIDRVLGPEDGPAFRSYYGVTTAGNFEGANILNVKTEPTQAANQLGLSLEELEEIIRRGKGKLLAVREERVHPLLDDKVLSSWNGMMLRSFAEAGIALGREDYLEAANKNAAFLLDNIKPQGRLLRSWREGEAKLLGYLEDYACVADGLLALHEATLEGRWLVEAVGLAESMIELFWDDGIGGFYDTGTDHETLVIRPRDVFRQRPTGGKLGGGGGPVETGGHYRAGRLRGQGYGSHAVAEPVDGRRAGWHRPLAGGAGLLRFNPQGDSHDWQAGRPCYPGVAGASLQPLPSQQGGGRRDSRCGGSSRSCSGPDAATGRPGDDERDGDGLCLPELRLPTAGNRC